MPSCAIKTCRNTDRSTKGTGIIYHSIPTDPEIRDHWIKYTANPGSANKRNRVCSEHFDEECYERDLKAELLNLPSKKRLKPNAVPTLKLTYSPEEYDVRSLDSPADSVTEMSMNIKVEYGVIPNEIDTYSSASSPTASPASFNVSQYDNNIDLAEIVPVITAPTGTSSINALPDSVTINQYNPCTAIDTGTGFASTSTASNIATPLEASAENQERLNTSTNGTGFTSNQSYCSKDNWDKMKTSLQRKTDEITKLRTNIKKARAETKKLKKRLAEAKRGNVKVKVQVKREVHRVLGKCFTPVQINRLLSDTRHNWQPEDIMSALSICAISLKAYVHLKDVIGIPFPGVATLKKWVPVFKDGLAQGNELASGAPAIDVLQSEDEEPLVELPKETC